MATQIHKKMKHAGTSPDITKTKSGSIAHKMEKKNKDLNNHYELQQELDFSTEKERAGLDYGKSHLANF